MVNTKAGETAQEIYDDLYKPGHYKDLWFLWQGKPLLICDPKEASPELVKFFTLRKAHWPFTLVNTHNAWHWESTYPQVFSYDSDPAQPEQVNVAVAQNLRASDGKVTNMSEGNARGRSFHDGKKDTSPGAVNQGYNFAGTMAACPRTGSAVRDGDRVERVDRRQVQPPRLAGRVRGSVRPGIQPRHRAGRRTPQRQLLLPVGCECPPLQGLPGPAPSLGGPIDRRGMRVRAVAGGWSGVHGSRLRQRPSRLWTRRPALHQLERPQ